MQKEEIIKKIQQLKKEQNAIILAHNYQNIEIQEIADFIGDSLELARISSQVKESTIVFCGVFFMAETAHILAPEKTVLLPVLSADCPMARMVDTQTVLETKKKYPEAIVMTYVNSTADVKAVSDICCTSSNAMKIAQALSHKQIIFVPDKNLGRNISRFIPKEFIYVEGYCPVHEHIKAEEILKIKETLPDAELIFHPEVNPSIAIYADKLLSTGHMLTYAKNVSGKTLVIGTESGLFHRLQKEAPQNRYFNIGRDLICPNMKKIRLENVLESLEKQTHKIVLPADIREKAKNAITKMLDYSK